MRAFFFCVGVCAMLVGVTTLAGLGVYGIYCVFASGETLFGTVLVALLLTLGGIVLASSLE